MFMDILNPEKEHEIEDSENRVSQETSCTQTDENINSEW